MKFNSIIATVLISQVLSDTPTDECIKEKKCANEDVGCLFECLTHNITKPNNWNEKLECASKCPWDKFIECTNNCYNSTYKEYDNNHKQGNSNSANTFSPSLYTVISLSLSYWLIEY